jgi:AraC-like DNA-binding protein
MPLSKPVITYYKSPDRKLGIVCGRGISRRFPVHRHQSVSLGMVVKGSRLLTIGRSRYVIAEGDVFIVNSGEPHAIGETYNREHDYIVLSMAPDLLMKHGNPDLPHFENIHESELLSEYLKKLFHLLILNCDQPPDVDLDVLIAEMRRFAKKGIPAREKDTRLEKVKELLDRSIEDNHPLSSLADKAAISEFHLARLFKSLTGMAPHQYLIDNRLRHARELLESGRQIIDIAIESGFYDTSHFIRHFTRYYGVSPNNFQKNIRELILK